MANRSKTLSLLLLLFGAAVGCHAALTKEAADAKWREDYAHCRYGMTPAQLEELPDTAGPPPKNRDCESCLQALGWQTRAGPRLGPEWDD